jgi:metal-responsive CopG/Arc/MetJ family transcriptional regulator
VKVTVSVPEPVFEAAERVSKRMRIPRSQLYSRAIAAFVRQHSGEDVTKALNAVYAKHASALDPAWEGASLEVLQREKW